MKIKNIYELNKRNKTDIDIYVSTVIPFEACYNKTFQLLS